MIRIKFLLICEENIDWLKNRWMIPSLRVRDRNKTTVKIIEI